MPQVLAIVWFSAATCGLIALAVAVAFPRWRRHALLVGAIAFGVAGVLGILSIGIVFVGLAALCLYGAGRASPTARTPHVSPSTDL